MDASPTAAQSVLAIPELLTAIIDYLPPRIRSETYGGPELRNRPAAECMYVNRMWYAIAARVAWKSCGGEGRSTWRLRGEKQNRPWMRDLVRLMSHPERLQRYANHIEFLDIYREGDRMQTWQSELSNDMSVDEARFNHLLVHFNFPRLQIAVITGTPNGAHFNVSPLIVQYLQPKLRSLQIESSGLSDSFFISLMVMIAHRLILLY